jgi:hypothetical protein
MTLLTAILAQAEAEAEAPWTDNAMMVLIAINTLLLLHVFWGQVRIARNQQKMAEALREIERAEAAQLESGKAEKQKGD